MQLSRRTKRASAKSWTDVPGRQVARSKSRNTVTLGIDLEDLSEHHHEISSGKVAFSTQQSHC